MDYVKKERNTPKNWSSWRKRDSTLRLQEGQRQKKRERVIVDNNVFPKAIIFTSSPWSCSSSSCLSHTTGHHVGRPWASVIGIHHFLVVAFCLHPTCEFLCCWDGPQISLFLPREVGASEAALTDEGSQTGCARIASCLTAVGHTAGPMHPLVERSIQRLGDESQKWFYAVALHEQC